MNTLHGVVIDIDKLDTVRCPNCAKLLNFVYEGRTTDAKISSCCGKTYKTVIKSVKIIEEIY